MKDTSREQRAGLIHQVARLLIPMGAMPLLGIWYLLVLPEDSRGWVLGGSAAMTLFLNVAIAASMAVGGYALIGLVYQRQYINGATSTLLLLLAFGATAGGEFVREGARKPFTIRGTLYSNGVRVNEVERLRSIGVTAGDPYPVRHAATLPDQRTRTGAKVYRDLCSVCHTLEGVNGVCHLTATWDLDQMRMNIAKLQQTKAFMPPFAGTALEVESLVQFLAWNNAGRPAVWNPDSTPDIHEKIQTWLKEAGTDAGRNAAKKDSHGGEK